MYNGITEDKLEKLGIYDLRRIARHCGVNSPTSKRRDILISEILRIQRGEQKPVFNKKIGRPVKTIGDEGDLQSNLIINGDKELEYFISPQKQDDNYIVLDQNFVESELPLSTNIIEFKGILSKTSQNNYFVISQIKIKDRTMVIIDENYIEKYNLIVGDLIHGTAYYYKNKGYGRVNEISEIDDLSAVQNKYNLDFTPIIPNAELDGQDFKMGQSKVHVCQNLDMQIQYIKEKTKKFNEKGCKCVVISLEARIETKLKLDMIDGLTQILTLMDEPTQYSFAKINDALNYSKSLLYHGQNVVVFVLNTLGVLSALDTYFKDRPGMYSDKTNFSVRKIIANSQATNIGSISTMCLLSQDDVELKPDEVKMIQRYCEN